MTHAMAGAMRVIQPNRPHRRACQRVDLLAGGAGRKARPGHGDMAAKNRGEGMDHIAVRRADGDGAGDVGRAVIVMRPRIH